jgi:glutaredoxin
MIKLTTVEGKKKEHQVLLYALSTCVWCKKTKKLLDDIGVCYDYVFVDELGGKDEEQVMKLVKKLNPEGTFPTLLIDDRTVFIGFREGDIRKALT